MHTLAMQEADKALVAQRGSQKELASTHFRNALELEAAAAGLTRDQPSRAILFRSAANLALECGDFDEAERLACLGLISRPPDDIAEELRAALDRANFSRHLRLQGITLSSAAIQLAIAGPSIGYGDAPEPEVMARVDTYRKLVTRAASRKRGLAYSDAPPQKLADPDYQLFMSTARAGSFAVTLRVGAREMQNHLDFDISPDAVVEDVFANLALFETNRDAELRQAIVDSNYRRNFVALARKLAPDGERVTTVGLTRSTTEGTEVVAMRQPRSAHPLTRSAVPSASSTTILEGRLELADTRGLSKSGRIVLSGRDTEYKIAVPKGMLADIVRPHFGEHVAVRARRRAKHAFQFIEFVDR
jgi:hypothetical protein